ncbi:hypothetical protein ACF082_11560 [Streptomyces lydicus]|uniref:hypothetical protein n=1 Tax=Streptomyces lydicus TaxID=47763 RepID=UPI0037000CFD
MSILDEAWASVPDVVRLEKLKADVDKRREAFGTYEEPDRARAAAIDEVIRDAMASGEWPDDAGEKAAEAHQGAVERQSEGLALYEASRSVREALKRSKEDNADDALTFLGDRLRDLMTEVKPLAANLGGVVSADGAIAKGGKALDAWKSLTDLLGVYRDIRAAQWEILKPPHANESGDLDAGPRFGRAKRSGRAEVAGFAPDNAPDWVVDALSTHSYSVPFLAWLAQMGTAFVPASRDELDAEMVVLEAGEVIPDGPLYDMSPMVTPIVPPAQPKREGDTHAARNYGIDVR